MTMTDNTTKEIMTDYKLDEYAADCAKQILEEINTHGGDEYDLAHEHADGSEWVIYYHKAHQICQNCKTENGEAFLEDVGSPEPITYDSLAVTIAYGELHARICQAIDTMKGEA